jgi:reactive intermediate/imine deaminase
MMKPAAMALSAALTACILLASGIQPAAAAVAIAAATTDAPAPQRAVLVTGASTGIGRRITEQLAAAGHFVYAGARKPEDLAALGKIPNVQAIRLDVTSDADLAAAVDTISKAGRGLYGLVNNAGVAVVGSLRDMKPQDFDFTMQVNVRGPFRVTQAFAPLIIESKGRITNISSISGVLSGPSLGAYSMSKHALEAFGDALAADMAPLGVHVSLVEPGNYNSDIGASAAKRAPAPERFADRSRFKDPGEVAAAVQLALFEPNPKRRYLVVPDAREAEITIRKAIEELAQLNERHAYSYDRDTLVRMLDQALTAAPPAPVQHLNSGRVLPAMGLPFSEAVRHGDTVYLSGQLGLQPGTMRLAAGGIEAESRQVMTNIRTTLEAHGLSMANLVKCTVMLADMKEWGQFNSIYTTFFDGPKPARSALGVNGLALGARVEVDCIAAAR